MNSVDDNRHFNRLDGPPPLVEPPAYSSSTNDLPPLVDPPPHQFIDNDGGPPPLVDPPSMTYTFLADMTPLTFLAVQHNPLHSETSFQPPGPFTGQMLQHSTPAPPPGSSSSSSSATLHYANAPPGYQYAAYQPLNLGAIGQSPRLLPPPSSNEIALSSPSSFGGKDGDRAMGSGQDGSWDERTMSIDSPPAPTTSYSSFQISSTPAAVSPFSSFNTDNAATSGATPQYTDVYPARTPSHGKKRDASYIPRPPNAFILFRSSFIRIQQVPGNVEGNHSTLSKIIGLLFSNIPTLFHTDYTSSFLSSSHPSPPRRTSRHVLENPPNSRTR